MNKSYFIIDSSVLRERTFFPFHLYIHNPQDGEYYPFICANSPFDNEKRKILKSLQKKGASLAVSQRQKLTFARSIKQLNLSSSDSILKISPKEARKSIKESGNNSSDSFKKALVTGNFLDFIKQTKLEILSLSNSRSNTMSLARDLANKYMDKDNLINRIIVTSLYFIKKAGHFGPDAFSDLVVAGYLSHLGVTQIHREALEGNTKTMSPSDFKEYKTHSCATQAIIAKGQIVLTERCHKIIYQHHEKADGTGYPEMQQESAIEPIALIYSGVSYILKEEARYGLPIDQIIEKIKLKSPYFGKLFSEYLQEVFEFKKAA